MSNNTLSGSVMNFPTQPEEINEEWLSSSLSTGYPGTRVAKISLDHSLGGTANKWFINVTYSANPSGLPSRFVLKVGLDDEPHRAEIRFIYRMEAKFYSSVGPRLPIQIPKTYYAADNGESGVLIMEDIISNGGQICSIPRPLTFEETAAFLDGFAAMHAAFWNSPELNDDGELGWVWRQDPLPPTRADGLWGNRQFEVEYWDRHIKLPRAVAIPKVLHNRQMIRDAMNELRGFDDGSTVCLIHGDAHLGNLYQDKNGKPGFLDWQLFRRGHWAHDISYFLCSALDPLDRRRWEKDLVRGYLDALGTHGVSNVPTEEAAWSAIKAHFIYGLFIWMMNTDHFQSEVVNTAASARFAWAMVDHGLLQWDGVKRSG